MWCTIYTALAWRLPCALNSTSYHRPLALRRCVVFCDTLFPTSTLSEFVFRYLPGRFAGSSWQLQYWQISHMSCRWYRKRSTVPLGRTLHVDPEAYTSTTVHPVEVHKQSHQASRRARTLEYCQRSCRRTTLTRVKIFVEIISWMTCNLRNWRKFRPAKFKRYTVYHGIEVTFYSTQPSASCYKSCNFPVVIV